MKHRIILSIAIILVVVMSGSFFHNTAIASHTAKHIENTQNYLAYIKQGIAKYLYDNGVTKVKPENTNFEQPLKRRQVAILLKRLFKDYKKITPLPGERNCEFEDIYMLAGNDQSELIEACKIGIMQGSQGKVRPESEILREHVFIILARLTANNGSIGTLDDALKILDEKDLALDTKSTRTIGKYAIKRGELYDHIMDILRHIYNDDKIIDLYNAARVAFPEDGSQATYQKTEKVVQNNIKSAKNSNVQNYEQIINQYCNDTIKIPINKGKKLDSMNTIELGKYIQTLDKINDGVPMSYVVDFLNEKIANAKSPEQSYADNEENILLIHKTREKIIEKVLGVQKDLLSKNANESKNYLQNNSKLTNVEIGLALGILGIQLVSEKQEDDGIKMLKCGVKYHDPQSIMYISRFLKYPLDSKVKADDSLAFYRAIIGKYSDYRTNGGIAVFYTPNSTLGWNTIARIDEGMNSDSFTDEEKERIITKALKYIESTVGYSKYAG